MTSSFRLRAFIGLTILLFEAAVTVLGISFPRVDRGYRDYYISHTTSCWLTGNDFPRALAALRTDMIRPADLDPVSTCFLLGQGWSFVEPWGVWSDGQRSDLTLPYQPGKSAIVFTLTAFSPKNRQSVTIYANGVFEGGYFVSNQHPNALRITVPPAGPDGLLKISFRIKHPLSPYSFGLGGDLRRLGIGLVSINWQ